MAPNAIPRLSSYATALVLIPPPNIQSRVNPIRSTNDKSFPRWTSHLTLVFPFVEPDQLPKASSLIRDALSEAKLTPFEFQLDKVANFKQRDYDTVYLGPSQSTDVQRVWSVVSSAVGYSGRPFVPHLTLGQAYHSDQTTDLLHDKGQLLLDTPIKWDVGSVIVLLKSDLDNGLMKIYEEIPLSPDLSPSPSATIAGLHPTAYQLSSNKWAPVPDSLSLLPAALTLATYNVLSDADHPAMPRLPRLVSTLLSLHPSPDIICLQEVTDEVLRHLLADTSIRARWPRCTHDPNSVLPGKHNIIFLARESLVFSWEYVPLRGKHKAAVVLRFRSASAAVPQADGSPHLVIAGLHLTAGLSSSQQQTKVQELEKLLTFLRERYSGSLWVLIGDTNIPTSQLVPPSILNSLDDAWLAAKGSEEGGATFDPSSNSLASETVKADRSPQRYDRIWFRRESRIQARTVNLFGHGPDAASDHYGLAATLQLPNPADSGTHNTPTVVVPSSNLPKEHRHVRVESTTASNDDLQQFVRRGGGFRTEAQQAELAQVTATLRATFSLPIRAMVEVEDATLEDPSSVIPSQSVVRFEFVPVGSVGLGVDTSGSDIDMLVVGNIPPRTFWTLARARLRKQISKPRSNNDESENNGQTPRVVLKRFVKDATVQMMELWVGNFQVDLQYCSGSKVLEKWDQIQELPPTDPVFLLPAPALRTLNAYRDMIHILRILPSSVHAAFRMAHRALKLFFISQGIYSSRLGYLGGMHTTLLLSRVALLSPLDASAMQLVLAFFAMYSNWDWANEAVRLPEIGDETTYSRSPGREPMVILSVTKPVRNFVQNANKHTANAIIHVLKKADRNLTKGVPWSDMCGLGGVCGDEFKTGFLRSHDYYVKIDLSFWGSSMVKVRAWTSFVESRLPNLLVVLQTSLPDWKARLWPARFVDGNNSGDLSTGIQSFYLLGLDAPAESTSVKKIQAALLAFEDRLRRDERFYDANDMFVSVSQITRKELPDTITTPPAWSDGGVDPDDDTSDDEEDLEPLDEEEDPYTAFAPISSKQKKSRIQQTSRGRNVVPVPAAKLRTSSDVYNRLLWDRELDTAEYLIGYEDRFSGIKEMPLANWKREVEDEAFVPFHRVVHFRRKSDGLLVWDRRKKIDLVFGSGVQQETPDTGSQSRT